MHWESRLRNHFRACAPLIAPLLARGGSAQGFLRQRVEELAFKRPQRSSKQQEKARLRREMADVFIELKISHKTTGGVLGARLIPVLGEEATLLSLFANDWVPLTCTTDIRPHYRNDQLRMTATLLLLTPERQTVLLGESDEFIDDPDTSLEEWAGFESKQALKFPAVSRVEMAFETLLSICQRPPHKSSKRELAVSMHLLGFAWDDDKELAYKSIVELAQGWLIRWLWV